jgi:hypothetical protein
MSWTPLPDKQWAVQVSSTAMPSPQEPTHLQVYKVQQQQRVAASLLASGPRPVRQRQRICIAAHCQQLAPRALYA